MDSGHPSDKGHFVSVGIGENKERCRFVGVNGKEQSYGGGDH